ncbi:MAG: hypothetical protein IJ249_07225 [Paludibacteraceae bacterium]|nr:hypothetical protein [Paludibacteraceae bacterium]
MKKLFSIFSALLLVTLAMQAAQVTQNVWGGSLVLTNDEFQPRNESLFAEGQTLRLTFVNNGGWMQVFHKNEANGWSSTDLVSGLDLSAGYVDVVLSSTAASEIQSYGGLYIKGENITLKSIDLIYDNGVAPEMDKTTLWEGEYINEIEISTEQVATMQSGNVIRVHVSVPEGGANFKIVYKGAPDWSETTIPSIDNQWPWVNGGETYKDFTLTDADITAFNGKEIYIYKGDNSVITKVELLQPAWVAASTWTGSTVGESETEINASYFASAVAGNKLRIHFTKSVEDSYYQMLVSVKDGSWNYHYYMNYETVTAPTQDIELEAGDNLDNLVARGLYLIGKNITITKVELLRLKVSSDEQAAAVSDEQDPTVLLENLSGETVDFTLNRTLYCDGYYNTLCLPFSLASLENTPLANAEVVTLVDADITGTKEGGDMVLNIEIEQVSAIEAGKPYLVSFPSGNDLTSMTFADVTISASEPQTIHTTLLDMVGILAPTEMAADTDSQLFLGANNTLYWSDGSAPLKGYRAYFRTNSVSVTPGMPARIVKHENTTTAISNVLDGQHAQKILRDGQLVIIRDGKQYNALGAMIK